MKKNVQQKKDDEVHADLDVTTRRAMELAQEKGASIWLTTIPLQGHVLALHKGAFRDAIALRYGWRPTGMAIQCVCGANNSVSHALSCAGGGFVIRRHNEIRDLTATLLQDVSTNVYIEPTLQPLTSEVLTRRTANREDQSRLKMHF